MAILTAQVPTSSGVQPTVITPAGGGDKVPVGSVVRVTNNNGASIDFTMTTHLEVDGSLAVADRVEAVPNTETREFEAASIYHNPVDGLVDILCSATTGVALEVRTK